MSDLSGFALNGKKIIGIAANYKSLIKILQRQMPQKPEFFMKPTTAYITEPKEIIIPAGFAVNQEIELGVIIGKKCKNISQLQAMDYVGGYCAALDMTATCQMKEARANGGSWTIGKGFDTACPVSEFVPKCAIPDPHNVQLWCAINGETKQEANTNDLIFSIPQQIAFISQFITLEKNDLVITGSPPGMGPVKPGDVIEGGIKDIVKMKYVVAK